MCKLLSFPASNSPKFNSEKLHFLIIFSKLIFTPSAVAVSVENKRVLQQLK
uniref:Uncharacterized protein n=1 Tax=Anguilla anguilla TaxID=7936 RepID=A0A0E9S5N3_ANGAN